MTEVSIVRKGLTSPQFLPHSRGAGKRRGTLLSTSYFVNQFSVRMSGRPSKVVVGSEDSQSQAAR